MITHIIFRGGFYEKCTFWCAVSCTKNSSVEQEQSVAQHCWCGLFYASFGCGSALTEPVVCLQTSPRCIKARLSPLLQRPCLLLEGMWYALLPFRETAHHGGAAFTVVFYLPRGIQHMYCLAGLCYLPQYNGAILAGHEKVSVLDLSLPHFCLQSSHSLSGEEVRA